MAGTQVTQPFSPPTPFYAGTGATFTSVPANSVALDGRVYAMDLNGYRHTGLPSFREGVVSSGEPSDQLFNPNGGWWRYRYDWSYGMGQPIADLDDDVLGRRYDYSEGLNPWEPNALSLQPLLADKYQPLSSTGYQLLGSWIHKYRYDINDYLIVSNGFETMILDKNGAAVPYTTNGSESFGAHIICNSGNGYVTNFETIHNQFYSVVEDRNDTIIGIDFYNNKQKLCYGIIQNDVLTSKQHETLVQKTGDLGYGPPPTLFKIVGNTLLCGFRNTIYEITTDATNVIATPLYTHIDEKFQWTTAFNIGSRIYVGGYGADESSMFAMTVTSTGNLAIGSQATVFPSDEKLYGGFGYAGNAILWGNRGLRFATLSGDGSLTYGGLIETDLPVTTAYAYQKFIWFGWDRPDGKLQLGRISLEDFTDTLTPAYATDLISDDLTTVASLYIGSFVDTTFDIAGKPDTFTEPFTWVLGSDGQLRYITSDFVTTGYLTTGDIYFGTAENKSLGRVEVRFDALNTGESVVCEVIDSETGTVIGSRTVAVPGAKELVLTPQGTTFNRAHLKLTLNGPGTSTPVVRQWKMSAYPIAPSTQQWQIPLIIGRTTLVGGTEGALVSYDPWDEINFVRDLWRNRTVFTYTEGVHYNRVRIDNFSVEPNKWDDAGEWLELVLTVQLISVE